VATGYPTASTATATTSVTDLYKKQNTDVEIAIKLMTEEADWFQEYPRNRIVLSANENRVPLVLTQPLPAAFIPEGGKESIMSTPSPTHGTFLPVQMNKRHGFTALGQAYDSRAAAGMIENQLTYQANMSGYGMGWTLGLNTWGTSVGTVAKIRTTGTAGTAQSLILGSAFGSSTFVAGGDGGVQDTYLSSLFRVGTRIALIRSGAIVEFATVTASPGASGVGTVDATFTSSITPTAGDLIVNAMADADVTITGTDYNNAAYGFTDFLTGQPLGVSSTTYPKWTVGSSQTASQRLSFSVKERMINECFIAGGGTINRFAMPFGVRRDAISGELGGRRYDSSETDIEGDIKAGSGQKYYYSQLVPPNTLVGWYDKAIQKVELSSQQTGATAKSVFKLDKIQGVSATAAYYDWFYQRIPTSLALTGYATNLISA